jgi:hypothetical protein
MDKPKTVTLKSLLSKAIADAPHLSERQLSVLYEQIGTALEQLDNIDMKRQDAKITPEDKKIVKDFLKDLYAFKKTVVNTKPYVTFPVTVADTSVMVGFRYYMEDFSFNIYGGGGPKWRYAMDDITCINGVKKLSKRQRILYEAAVSTFEDMCEEGLELFSDLLTEQTKGLVEGAKALTVRSKNMTEVQKELLENEYRDLDD